MTSTEVKLIQVIARLEGADFEFTKRSLERDTSECFYQGDGRPTCCGETPQEHIIFRRSDNYSSFLVIRPCEEHLPRYLEKGWEIL